MIYLLCENFHREDNETKIKESDKFNWELKFKNKFGNYFIIDVDIYRW